MTPSSYMPPIIPNGLLPCGSPTIEGYVRDLINHTWAVVEYSVFDVDAPHGKRLIYILGCKLSVVTSLAEPARNSEWNKIVSDATYLYINVCFIGEKFAALREASNRVRALSPRPHCNARGYSLNNVSRPIVCSNGITYPSQIEAARALGINQGQLSRHLSGELQHVKCLTFAYKDSP